MKNLHGPPAELLPQAMAVVQNAITKLQIKNFKPEPRKDVAFILKSPKQAEDVAVEVSLCGEGEAVRLSAPTRRRV